MWLQFTHKTQEVDTVWSFYFEPLEPVVWLAGQSIRLELPRPSWGVDERRFTISSAPFEKHIRITTRSSKSNFKLTLFGLQTGDKIQGHAIDGNFIWLKDEPQIWIAGGIGITPLRAMCLQAAHQHQALDVMLFYCTKEKPAVFYDELKGLAATHPKLKLYQQTKRFILPVKSSLPAVWKQRPIYLSGPEGFIKSLAQDLIKHGVPQSNIKSDYFTGLASDE
jgi:ferredoxin-NADP reductase